MRAGGGFVRPGRVVIAGSVSVRVGRGTSFPGRVTVAAGCFGPVIAAPGAFGLKVSGTVRVSASTRQLFEFETSATASGWSAQAIT